MRRRDLKEEQSGKAARLQIQSEERRQTEAHGGIERHAVTTLKTKSFNTKTRLPLHNRNHNNFVPPRWRSRPECRNEEVAEEEDSILHLIASPVEGGRLSHKKTFYPDTERVRAKRDNCSTYKDTDTFLVPVPVGAKNFMKKTHSSDLHEFKKRQKKKRATCLCYIIILSSVYISEDVKLSR